MGYGVKKGLDLDLTYEKIIKPCIKKNHLSPVKLCDIEECNAYRGDEICSSQLIDTNIVSCISDADIVIADISTMSPNAIYELGVRHALKPRITIVMCAKNQNQKFRFFDLSFVHIIFYNHLGKTICNDEITRVKKLLNKYILFALNDKKKCIDSPIQQNIQAHNVMATSNHIPNKKNKSIYSLYTSGMKELNDCHYINASNILQELYDVDSCEENFLLFILAKYKISEESNNISDLRKCAKLLEEYSSNHIPETEEFYGRIGAVYLRLFNKTNKKEYYYKSLDGYRKGAQFSKSTLYCQRNYCEVLLKIFKITKSLKIIREYYYTSLHYAKIFSQFKLDTSNSLNKEQIIYYKYNLYDLLSIANNDYVIDDSVLNKISNDKHLTKRQKITLYNGIIDLKNDLKMINSFLN